MPAPLHVGCCGWSYLRVHDFDPLYTKPFGSQLQAYAQLFEAVEINSTFYRLPQIRTAEKWRREVDAITSSFTFTVKAYRGITHLHRFKGKDARRYFEELRAICAALRARIILFQSPASFPPTEANIKALCEFFRSVQRDGLVCVWEPRGAWHNDSSRIAEVCETNDVIHAVDPLRHQPALKQPVIYFRLHGFGKPSMYRYDFSVRELETLGAIVASSTRGLREGYVFFNNVECYKNGLEFMEMVPGRILKRTRRTSSGLR